ncbi:glycosyltransferase family 1 protein [Ruegeria sp. 6PALISEP08]|uniref:glycosyltransferase family 4 protein n=1 Tax=Ruegeria sp. 6PALISEP08 TaxID=1225660 RepID=UPI00067E712D|nr:glycosyltransferase family 1 protein [Ruegeria sp. 6PALISEP08]
MVKELNAAEKRQVVYDLTEVLLASTGKLRYYGIAKVVAEIGAELKKQDTSVRFAVFSQGHDELLEIYPSLRADGGVDLNVPVGIRQLRVRSYHHTKSLLRDLVLAVVRPFVQRRNRKAWDAIAPGMTPINMAGKTLVSCGRPKLIVEILCALDRKGVSCDIIPLLHDMIPMHDFEHQLASFPRNFIGDNQLLVSRAKALLANSEFTRQEILDFSKKGILPEAPEVFAVPLVHECPEGTEQAEQDAPEQPYILTVGSMLGRKNLDVVFEAMRLLKRDGKDVPTLVLAGALRHKTTAYLQSDECSTIREHVVFRENPNQTDLVNLYKNALALILPSRMEGWGLPAGEALWLGTPALCSTAVALKEVCGDLGIYFDPDRADQLADHITRLLSDPDFTGQLRARIAARKPQLRTWTDVAADLREVLQKLGY